MISISVVARLAKQPELVLLQGGERTCEFTLLTTRHHYQQSITESVTFFCYGDMAEDSATNSVTGQEMSATGTQETRQYTDNQGVAKRFVRYRLSWFSFGRKPANPGASMNQSFRQQHASSQIPSGIASANPHKSDNRPLESPGTNDQSSEIF